MVEVGECNGGRTVYTQCKRGLCEVQAGPLGGPCSTLRCAHCQSRSTECKAEVHSAAAAGAHAAPGGLYFRPALSPIFTLLVAKVWKSTERRPALAGHRRAGKILVLLLLLALCLHRPRRTCGC